MTDRTELAAFLRDRRARLRPADVGLTESGPRRTPGLRRQEVAQLAGISVEYYIRIEQCRGPRPSQQVLAALARALLLSVDERDYLLRTAGYQPPPVAGPIRTVPPSIRVILDTMTETPAYVVDATYDVLAWNRLAVPFLGDLGSAPESERNMVRWIFRTAADHHAWSEPETLAFARSTVADLRAAYARYPGHPALTALVTELLGTAPRFARMWEERDVRERRTHRKKVDHPDLGTLEFECQVLHVSDTDQRMIVYCAEPNSPTARIFRSLGTRTATTPRGPHGVADRLSSPDVR
ncbi:helix-turn-helix transcriptional regulator [Nocardia arizonensis]|uniref:helix-turn-helix transcriptional regulator n=1 Tax=Nocardia arizonensis TaxID=1141647 RepID=UPI0009EBE6EC|nr:helix-turn-helix transcriptional regulator [Nocardia arizonensis]